MPEINHNLRQQPDRNMNDLSINPKPEPGSDKSQDRKKVITNKILSDLEYVFQDIPDERALIAAQITILKSAQRKLQKKLKRINQKSTEDKK